MNRIRELADRRGQSLVETALFLPILIFMLAGIVEVSNLLITQNRVTTSSRMAAGYGAANFDRDNWANAGGTAEDMGIVALNTISESMPLNTDQWDIYSAHGLTTQDGTGFEVFESEWVYGAHVVVTDAEWAAMEAEIQANVLDALQAECGGDTARCAGNIEFVVSVPFHNLDTLIGLPVWQWVGFQRVRGMTVMRVRPVVEAAGCAILPIAVRINQYALYPSNWPEGQHITDPPNLADPVALFPQGTKQPGGFQLPDRDADGNKQTPNPQPVYLNNEIAPNLDTDTFTTNSPGISLQDALVQDDKYSGSLFWARDFTAEGGFGWLSWNGDTDQPALIDSLVPPGNFEELYPGSNADLSVDDKGDPLRSFTTGDGDGWIERFEWVEGATGNMNQQSAQALYYPYVKEGREVGILVFTQTDEEGGANRMYEAWDFITVKILGFSFGGSDRDKWVLFEFISSDLVCGPGSGI